MDDDQTYPEQMLLVAFAIVNKPIEKGTADPIRWDALPVAVREAIVQHFDKVFALPIERRDEYLKNLQPIIVEV